MNVMPTISINLLNKKIVFAESDETILKRK